MMRKSVIYLLLAFVMPVISADSIGDTLLIGDRYYKVLSGNAILNASFEDGFTSWTDATTASSPLSSDYFTLASSGAAQGSKYLIGKTNQGSTSIGSIGTGWSISANKMYYFSYQVKYIDNAKVEGDESWLKVSLTNDKSNSNEPLKLLDGAHIDGGGQWTRNELVFTNSDPSYTYIMARFRWLNNNFAFDDFKLYEVEEVINTSELQALIDQAKLLYTDTANLASELLQDINSAEGLINSHHADSIVWAIETLNQSVSNYKIANASKSEPLDFTHYIINPSFEESFNGWQNAGLKTQSNAVFTEKDGNTYAEQWVDRGSQISDVVLSQDLVNMPNGNYTLTVGAGHIQQTGSGSTVNIGSTVQTGVYVYANQAQVSIDTMQQYAINFSITNNTITIGLKAENATGNWLTFDDFSLLYNGKSSLADYVAYLENYIEVAEGFTTKKLRSETRQSIYQIIELTKELIVAQPQIEVDLINAKSTLDSILEIAQGDIDAYAMLSSRIAYGSQLLAWYSEDASKVKSLNEQLDIANTTYDSSAVSQKDLKEATASLNSIIASTDKKLHIPNWMMGDVNDESNSWSLTRSKQSKNWIVFWEPGYGENPSTYPSSDYKVNLDALLAIAEDCFVFYADSLDFITLGDSKTDNYKMIIRLRYTRDWEATGSGVDDQIGLLTLTAWSAQAGGHTLAHEVGHCFQYQVHCDNNDNNGWMYGFGANASGGNGWWEQCAQWQGFKVFSNQQFSAHNYSNYLKTTHKHILHETPRYDNYFIQDYWSYLHGAKIIGQLWNKSKKPEDPVEAYKRITNITQEEFNDQMYDCASRFVTWDIPVLKAKGANYIGARPQPVLNNVGDDFWMIDPDYCVENYGHNIIKLNVPSNGDSVKVYFQGKAGAEGYLKKNIIYAGWRFGFVMQDLGGKVSYSEMKSAKMSKNGGEESLTFACPKNCMRLWLVVTGAPSVHWRHAWDDDDSNDEQWPYQVKFQNTNLLGHSNPSKIEAPSASSSISMYGATAGIMIEGITEESTISVYDMQGRSVLTTVPNTSSCSIPIEKGIYFVRVNSQRSVYTQKVLVD